MDDQDLNNTQMPMELIANATKTICTMVEDRCGTQLDYEKLAEALLLVAASAVQAVTMLESSDSSDE